MTKQKLTVLAWVFIVAVLIVYLLPKKQTEPCFITVSRKDSVENIEQWIAECEVAIEQTSLEFDELSKKRQNELDQLKSKNENRRKEITRIKKEVLGLSWAPTTGGAEKE